MCATRSRGAAGYGSGHMRMSVGYAHFIVDFSFVIFRLLSVSHMLAS